MCVMMTSSDFDDEFSFVINDDMVMSPLGRNHCEVRCQLIQFVPLESIITNSHHNQLRVAPFKNLIKKITDSTFSTEDL